MQSLSRLLLTIVLMLSFARASTASILRIEKVTIPVYLHGSDTDSLISFESVPCGTMLSDPEWRYLAIATPFIPPSVGSWKAEDINLTSVYRISVSGTYDADGKTTVVIVDASKAVRPEGYPFTIEQVIDSVVTCVKMMTPTRPADEGELKINVTGLKRKK